jgi:hypothetical protein
MTNSLEMFVTPKQAETAPRWRLLWPLLLGGLFILILSGQWFWLTRSLAAEAQVVFPAARSPLITALFQQKATVWSVALSTGSMTLAMFLALSPLRWWVYLHAMLRNSPGDWVAYGTLKVQKQQSAEEWVAEQAALLQTAPGGATHAAETAAPLPAMNQVAAGTAPLQNSPAPTHAPTGVSQPQLDSQKPVAQPVATIQPQPDIPPAQAPQPGPAQPQSVQPQPAVPAAPALHPEEALQQLVAQEESVDLVELTNIGDILNSFKDTEDVSTSLLALSQSLDEIETAALVAACRQVAQRLTASNRSPRAE